MGTMIVERSIVIDAPRERVWQAVTDPDQIAQWMIPNIPGVEVKRDDTGQVTIHFYGTSIDFAVLEIPEPSRRASLRSYPDGLVTSTYTLKDENNGTQVTVTMTGFESMPADARDEKLQLSSTAWEKTLQNLSAYLAGEELPNPTAFVAPLFGYWRETKTFAVERSIWIKAKRERVWGALTDPKQYQQWFSPTTPWELSALEVGGRFYVQNTETNAEMYVQVIEVLDPPAEIAFRQLPETPETEVRYTKYTLTEENAGTRLMLLYSGVLPKPGDAHLFEIEQHTFGFGQMLQNLKAHLEGTPLPVPGGF